MVVVRGRFHSLDLANLTWGQPDLGPAGTCWPCEVAGQLQLAGQLELAGQLQLAGFFVLMHGQHRRSWITRINDVSDV